MFKENDIESILYFSEDEVRGRYNHLDWSIQPSEDDSALMDTVVSLHEFAHLELNLGSAYGGILRAYAYLQNAKVDYKTICNKKLTELVKRCKIAHEIYATWYSITMMKRDGNDLVPDTLLSDNKEYTDYYNVGNNLVKDIPIFSLKHFILLTCINFCFQSKEIALEAEKDLLSFTLKDIREVEFPSKRLEILCDSFPSSFLRQMLEDFCLEKLGINLFNDGLDPDTHFDSMTTEEQFYFFSDMNMYFQSRFNTKFESLNSFSFVGDEHFEYLKNLLGTIHQRYTSEIKTPFHFFSTDPKDVERNMVINFESEIVLFSNRPLSCKVVLPEEVTEKEFNDLPSLDLSDPFLIIEGAHMITLTDQYSFINQTDEEYFKDPVPLTFIRFASQVNEKEIITIIPFSTHEQFMNFIKKLPDNVALFCAISYSASSNEEWWDTWHPIFAQHAKDFVFINDISLVLFVETYLADKENVTYNRFTIKANNMNYGFIYFQFQADDNSLIFTISPCSDAFFELLNNYIQKKYSAYTNNPQLAKVNFQVLELFALNIIHNQHSFYYRNESLAQSQPN